MTIEELSDRILDDTYSHSGVPRKENSIAHYGVPGMKWGVRKEYEPHPRKRSSKGTSTVNESKKKVSLSDKKSGLKLSKKQKIAIGVGIGVVGGLIAAKALHDFKVDTDFKSWAEKTLIDFTPSNNDDSVEAWVKTFEKEVKYYDDLYSKLLVESKVKYKGKKVPNNSLIGKQLSIAIGRRETAISFMEEGNALLNDYRK